MENFGYCTCEHCNDEILYDNNDLYLGGDYATGQLIPCITCPTCGKEIVLGYAKI